MRSFPPFAANLSSPCPNPDLAQRQHRQPRRPESARAARSIKSPSSSPSSSSSSAPSLLALVLLTSAVLLSALPCSNGATFFYGATENSGNGVTAAGESDETAFDGHPALALAESAAASGAGVGSEEFTLSAQELQSVFEFCRIWPLLEAQGAVKENKHASEICAKLVVMLKPMFKGQNKKHSISSRTPTRADRGSSSRRRRMAPESG